MVEYELFDFDKREDGDAFAEANKARLAHVYVDTLTNKVRVFLFRKS